MDSSILKSTVLTKFQILAARTTALVRANQPFGTRTHTSGRAGQTREYPLPPPRRGDVGEAVGAPYKSQPIATPKSHHPFPSSAARDLPRPAMEMFYYLVFGALSAVVAALELGKSGKDRVATSPAFNSFKNNYILVYSLMMCTHPPS